MSKEDKDWLLKSFPQYLNRVLRGYNKDAYIRVETLLSGRVTFPDCSCSYGSYQQKINKLYYEWASTRKETT